jgi:hypothetical protein
MKLITTPHSQFHPLLLLLLLVSIITINSSWTSKLLHLNVMESLLHQSKAMCPFLKKTSPGTLRSLSTATHHSPGGGTITNLQFIARRCPVMNKALAVQSARMRTSHYSTSLPSIGVVKSMMARKLHTTAEKKANVDTRVYRKGEEGRLKGLGRRTDD